MNFTLNIFVEFFVTYLSEKIFLHYEKDKSFLELAQANHLRLKYVVQILYQLLRSKKAVWVP